MCLLDRDIFALEIVQTLIIFSEKKLKQSEVIFSNKKHHRLNFTSNREIARAISFYKEET